MLESCHPYMKKEMITDDDKFRLIKFNNRYQINNIFFYTFPTKLLIQLPKKLHVDVGCR